MHAAKKKNLPSFSRVGTKSWFIGISYAASLWQKLWWKIILKNLILKKKKRAQIPGECVKAERRGESLFHDSSRNPCKSVGGSWTRKWALQVKKLLQIQALTTSICPWKLSRPNTCQLDNRCKEMRTYPNSNSAPIYVADYCPNNADYVNDPYSENRHNLFPLQDWTNVKWPQHSRLESYP